VKKVLQLKNIHQQGQGIGQRSSGPKKDQRPVADDLPAAKSEQDPSVRDKPCLMTAKVKENAGN
jgi:hypothetical protein